MRLVLCCLLLAGCPKRGVDDDAEALAAAMRAVDRTWAARGSVGLDGVEAVLATQGARWPSRPEVLWRRARLQVARGLVADSRSDAARSFARARFTAVSCLDLHPGFRRTRQGAGWSAALRRLDEGQNDCTVWAAVAWTRWVQARGAVGMALDLDVIEALLDHVDGREVGDGLVPWTWAVLASTRPGPATAATVQGLTEAVRAGVAGASDDVWVRWADLGQADPEAAALSRPTRPPRTPEERAAVERVEGASGGPGRRSPAGL